ncbi:MAG: hypothetical protein KY433_06490 [Actinobacteria bacterium]|nr:hypothetical protein [Actinomycetota bacterium]
MKKLAMVATLAAAAAAVAVPAQASKPDQPGSQRAAQGKAHEQSSQQRGSSKAGKSAKGKGRCAPRSVGYVAFGDYVSGALTQTQGADTADTTRDDRWSGELVVAVKRTNRHARDDKGTTKTYLLKDAKVRLADRDGDGTRDVPVAGDRTRIQGKITRLNRGCDTTGFTAALTIRAAGFHAPKAAEMPAPDPVPAA